MDGELAPFAALPRETPDSILEKGIPAARRLPLSPRRTPRAIPPLSLLDGLSPRRPLSPKEGRGRLPRRGGLAQQCPADPFRGRTAREIPLDGSGHEGPAADRTRNPGGINPTPRRGRTNARAPGH